MSFKNRLSHMPEFFFFFEEEEMFSRTNTCEEEKAVRLGRELKYNINKGLRRSI